MVCKELGFPNGAIHPTCCSYYGLVPNTFSYDDVQCSGNETHVDNCTHLNTHNCGQYEGAGVVCNPDLGITSTYFYFRVDRRT